MTMPTYLKFLVLLLTFSIGSINYGYSQLDSLSVTDSTIQSKNDLIFERIVDQRLMGFPIKDMFSDEFQIIAYMMLLSDDGYFGYSKSNYLSIVNGWPNFMVFKDIHGLTSELEINGKGNFTFYYPDGRTITSFRKGVYEFAIKDEHDVIYDLTFDMWRLLSIKNSEGYSLDINRIKRGFSVIDNANNSVELKNSGISKMIATYSSGYTKRSEKTNFGYTNSILVDNQPIFSMKYDYISNNYLFKDSEGIELNMSNQYKPYIHNHDHNHTTFNVGGINSDTP